MLIILIAASVTAGALAMWAEYSYSKELRSKAEGGDIQAQYELGICYREGAGVKKDPEQASLWLMKAANGGHAEAGFLLQSLFENDGEDVEEDD